MILDAEKCKNILHATLLASKDEKELPKLDIRGHPISDAMSILNIKCLYELAILYPKEFRMRNGKIEAFLSNEVKEEPKKVGNQATDVLEDVLEDTKTDSCHEQENPTKVDAAKHEIDVLEDNSCLLVDERTNTIPTSARDAEIVKGLVHAVLLGSDVQKLPAKYEEIWGESFEEAKKALGVGNLNELAEKFPNEFTFRDGKLIARGGFPVDAQPPGLSHVVKSSPPKLSRTRVGKGGFGMDFVPEMMMNDTTPTSMLDADLVNALAHAILSNCHGQDIPHNFDEIFGKSFEDAMKFLEFTDVNEVARAYPDEFSIRDGQLISRVSPEDLEAVSSRVVTSNPPKLSGSRSGKGGFGSVAVPKHDTTPTSVLDAEMVKGLVHAVLLGSDVTKLPAKYEEIWGQSFEEAMKAIGVGNVNELADKYPDEFALRDGQLIARGASDSQHVMDHMATCGPPKLSRSRSGKVGFGSVAVPNLGAANAEGLYMGKGAIRNLLLEGADVAELPLKYKEFTGQSLDEAMKALNIRSLNQLAERFPAEFCLEHGQLRAVNSNAGHRAFPRVAYSREHSTPLFGAVFQKRGRSDWEIRDKHAVKDKIHSVLLRCEDVGQLPRMYEEATGSTLEEAMRIVGLRNIDELAQWFPYMFSTRNGSLRAITAEEAATNRDSKDELKHFFPNLYGSASFPAFRWQSVPMQEQDKPQPFGIARPPARRFDHDDNAPKTFDKHTCKGLIYAVLLTCNNASELQTKYKTVTGQSIDDAMKTLGLRDLKHLAEWFPEEFCLKNGQLSAKDTRNIHHVVDQMDREKERATERRVPLMNALDLSYEDNAIPSVSNAFDRQTVKGLIHATLMICSHVQELPNKYKSITGQSIYDAMKILEINVLDDLAFLYPDEFYLAGGQIRAVGNRHIDNIMQ